MFKPGLIPAWGHPDLTRRFNTGLFLSLFLLIYRFCLILT
ncbi:hypothetical protein LTSEUGA_3053 [Salmonella enterica subsp. enterica serovar Uganda str. R8-3404]|uniref:Uncharacterized protein n=1 Tax=Salmonella enterica subsp. enterica serovar Uganda str. R8-3404 TaxID=913083 RepID=A0A6C8H0P8_SALET|nr:hypothetical protein LTSEUGA_3053 [Salmonella enterica subsp. enterica serovar Uganda str. R8-3404]